MHKNTFFLVLILAVIAALLVGVNIGKKFQPLAETLIPTQPASASNAVETNTASPTLFTSPNCGITLTLPQGTSATEVATNSAQFVSADSTVVAFGCEKEIPSIALPPEQMETIQVASIEGTLYHTNTPKDGTPMDVLLFRNPEKSMDVFLAGLGSTFSAIINSLTILP